MADKVRKTDAEWRQQLTPQQYRIAREAGTERAFTGEYCDTKTDGTYTCVCCGHPLFDSRSKFDSGTGWPSFGEPVADGHVDTTVDHGLGMVRNEVLCARCDAHLGHVFDDGPGPGGKRYCVNSIALAMIERGDDAHASVRRFARALDLEDYDTAAALLDPASEYMIRGKTYRGPAEIIESYREAAAWAADAFDEVGYESEVHPTPEGKFRIRFADVLRHGTRRHRHECEQHVELTDEALIRRIEHIDPPGERERTATFLSECGITPRPRN